MIQHVWERVSQASGLARVLVATDDERVASVVQSFGGNAVLTERHLPSGTDRVAEAVRGIGACVVLNVQGDEPLIDPAMVTSLVELMKARPSVPMATLKRRLADSKEAASPNLVKVVTDENGWALYFSRSLIPYARRLGPNAAWFKHIGIYAYQGAFLKDWATWPPSPLEEMEGLEQLRALERGGRILVLETPHDTVGVDVPEDLARVERLLTADRVHRFP